MIHGDDPYGWGVFSIPMPHEVRPADPAGMPLFRLLTRDIPWRPVLFSVGMTCLVCIALLFFGPREPTALARPEPTPLEVTVMLPPEGEHSLSTGIWVWPGGTATVPHSCWSAQNIRAGSNVRIMCSQPPAYLSGGSV